LVFKTTGPPLSADTSEALEQIIGYIEDLKAESEAKLSYIELTIERIKEQITSLKEAEK